MDCEKAVIYQDVVWQLAEPLLVLCCQLICCPEQGLFGDRVEVIDTAQVQCSIIVVAPQAVKVTLATELDTLIWIWVVAYEITQADNLVDLLIFKIFYCGLEGLEIGVNVTYDSITHREAAPFRPVSIISGLFYCPGHG